jgi:hypothetical protein
MADHVTEEDTRSYLLTEARIIAEDDSHVTIAVRIEKAMIARNFPFLTALADLIPSRGGSR